MIPWRPTDWARVKKHSHEAAVAVEQLPPGGIRRDDVRRVVADNGDLAGFVAAMIWGFGTTAYGPHRVFEMLTEQRDVEPPVDVIHRIMVTARSEGVAAGFGSLWSKGRTRVHGLGTAFGTKALYFAGTGGGAGPVSLVLDQFVFAGAGHVRSTGVEVPVPDPRRYLKRAGYAEYCEWAGNIAARAGVAPDCVEYALFKLGKGQVSLDGS